MRWPIVAFNAIDPPFGGLLDLSRRHIEVSNFVFGHRAIRVFCSHPRYHLPVLIGCDVCDLVRYVHVPVNTFNLATGRIAAAGVDEHSRLAKRVLLVVSKAIEHLQLSAEELRRPVTLLARILCRSKVVDGSWNRPGEFFERHGVDLVSAGEL